jgi:hypothetical protein
VGSISSGLALKNHALSRTALLGPLIRAMLASLRVAVVNKPKSLRRGRGFAVLADSLAALGAIYF